MWQKIKCWLQPKRKTYLVSYQFSDKKGSGFGKGVFKAEKIDTKTLELFEHQIKMTLSDNATVIIFNVLELDE